MPINFPSSPTIGQTYSSNTTTWVWNGTAWDIGAITLYGAYNKLDDVSSSFNGSNTTFNMAVSGAGITASTPNSLIISINGVIQEPGSAFTVSGSTITFTEAPATGSSFYGVLLGNTGTAATPADGSITSAKLSSTGVVAATYGNATIVPVITVDATGRITSASNTTISAGITTGKSIAMAIVFGG